MRSASPEVWSQFEAFVAGFTAAQELHNRAGAAGSFVECVCLGASLVDALLRIGVVLQYQLDNKTREIPTELIFQGANDKAIQEREIYRRAHSASVIDEATLHRLQSLYDQRNRVIHRYVISRITTADVLNIALGYEQVIASLMGGIREIERQQIEAGVGITVAGPSLDGEEGKRFLEDIADAKHTPQLARLIRRR